MTYRFLITILGVVLAFIAGAQDEVEFSVKKADLPEMHVYHYTDIVAEDLSNSFAIISASHYKNEFTYHSSYMSQQEKGNGERNLQMHYKQSRDTMYAGIITNGNTVYIPMLLEIM